MRPLSLTWIGRIVALCTLALACTNSSPTVALLDAATDLGPTCGTGQTVCGARCADLMEYCGNCGMCGHACGAGEVCAMGACATSCPAAQMACGGLCVSVQY